MKKLYLILWIPFLYLAVLLFVSNTSENDSYKNFNLIHNVSAELKFYQSTINNVYEKWLWSSENFPLQSVYEKVKVNLSWEPLPVDTGIRDSNVIINISTDSH